MQIYSGRKFPPLESQLAIVAAAGYDNIETFGPLHDDALATRRLLDARGLTAKSAHISLETLEARPEHSLEVATTLGLEFVVAPYLSPPRPTTTAGWKDIGARLARLADRFVASGFRFGWHNHDFEFEVLPDGSYPIEHLLGDSLLWEADLAWVVRAKADPEHWLERFAGRVPLVHVKDIAPAGEKADEEGWADVGTGVMPLAALWTRCVAAGAEIMIAEHDNPSDFARFARVSAEAMRGYARGAAR
jgi:sugar phosphate isomerase/epimerase